MFCITRLLIICVLTLLLNGCTSSLSTFNPEAANDAANNAETAKAAISKHTVNDLHTGRNQHGQVIQVKSSGALADASAYLGEIAPEHPLSGQGNSDQGKNVDSSLWKRMRQGFTMNHHAKNARVQAELAWFIKHPQYIDRVVSRAQPYLYQILAEIEARKLPAELALLPIVESAYDPFAYSPGKASGLWQFIPATARMLDMKMDWWTDERRDIQKSTDAALVYLTRLKRSFKGDWLLALASYNAGGRNIRAAVRKNKNNNKPTDFWSLKLFRETTSYVPRLLALSMIVAEPEKYGLKLQAVANEPYWTEVDTMGQLDLARAAQLADISTKEIYLLNPSYNQWSTHPDGPHKLILPLKKAELFKTRLSELEPGDRLRWILHQVKKGETLQLIAQRNGTRVESIKRINKLKSDLIHAGKSLMIPLSSFSDSAYAFNEENGSEVTRQSNSDRMKKEARPEVIRKVNYSVRNGESLSLIANKFNLSVGKIRKWNNSVLKQSLIQPGQRLTLYVDVTQTE